MATDVKRQQPLATEKGRVRDKTRLFSILTLDVIGMVREVDISGAFT